MKASKLVEMAKKIAKELSNKNKLAVSSYVTFSVFWNCLRFIAFSTKRTMIFDMPPYCIYLLSFYVIFFNIIMEDRGKLAVARQRETELKSDIMLSQIQPHFLYNALTAIRGLCKENPDMAYDEIGYFSKTEK